MLAVFALLLAAVVGRLVQIQALSPERLEELGDSQVVRSITAPSPAGSARGRLPSQPPPVRCAIEWMCVDERSARNGAR